MYGGGVIEFECIDPSDLYENKQDFSDELQPDAVGTLQSSFYNYDYSSVSSYPDVKTFIYDTLSISVDFNKIEFSSNTYLNNFGGNGKGLINIMGA